MLDVVIAHAIDALSLACLLCLYAYWLYAVATVVGALSWRRTRSPAPADWTPAVTLLKPLRGVDFGAYDNLASFCRLDYPADRLQIVFGALDTDDPALDVARRIRADYPGLDIAIVGGQPPRAEGPNRKACNLATMFPIAKHDLLVLSDSDMRVDPDYLRRVTAPFAPDGNCWLAASGAANPKGPGRRAPVGLVTCPYRATAVHSPAGALEALGIGADFIPSALVSRLVEGVRFAFGSTIAIPRGVLNAAGGFEGLTGYLADDNRLAAAVIASGKTAVLSDYVVADVLGPESFRTMWTRRVRWARTVRACRPAGYAGSLVTHGLVLAGAFALLGRASGLAGFVNIVTVVTVLARLTSVCVAARATRDAAVLRLLPLLPLSDLFGFVVFCAGFGTRTIVWRGDRYRVEAHGSIRRAAPSPDKHGTKTG